MRRVTDELVPLPDAVRSLPAPRDVGRALREALTARVNAEREARGEVHQPEDVSPLVRSLAGAKELLDEYARAFTGAAGLAREELDEELLAAVGEQDGVPLSGLTVPDLDGTDIRITLNKTNNHNIHQYTVLTAVIGHTIARMKGGEPEQRENEPDEEYDDRYWSWVFRVIERVLDQVLNLGSYSMQVSKVQAYAVALAGQGEDNLAAVVRGSIKTTQNYRGTKLERKERKEKKP